MTRVPDNLPIHKTASLSSPLSLTSSTSGGEHTHKHTHTHTLTHSHTHTHARTHARTHTHTHTHTHTVYSEPSIDPKKVSERTRLLQSNITVIKAELKKLRSDHISKMADFSLTLSQTSNQITAALRTFVRFGGVGSGGEEFRQERIELYRDEESYEKFSKETLSELK